MLTSTVAKPLYSKRYMLDKLSGAVAAYSFDKLSSKVQSPCTVSFGSGGVAEGSPDLVTSFLNGTLNRTEIETYLSRNRVTTDVISETWSTTDGTGNTIVRSIDDGYRKIEITASTPGNLASDWVYIDNTLAGETLNLQCSYKVSGNVKAGIWVNWYAGGSYITTTTIPYGTSTSYTTLTNTALTAPPTATKAQLNVGLRPLNSGDTGSAWFKDVSLVKVPTYIYQNTMKTGTTTPSGWAKAGAATGTTDVSSTDGTHIDMTASTTRYHGVNIYYNSYFTCSQKEVVRLNFNYRTKLNGGAILFVTNASFYRSDNTLISQSSSSISLSPLSFKNTTASFTVPDIADGATPTKFAISFQIQADTVGGGDTGEAWVKDLYVFRTNASAYITQMTDQSGNGNHTTQATLANMPRILNNGLWDTDVNGKLRMVFDSTDQLLKTGVNIPNNIGVAYVGNSLQTSGARFITLTSDTPANNAMVIPSCGGGSPSQIVAGERYPNSYNTTSNNINENAVTPIILTYSRTSPTYQETYFNGKGNLSDTNTTASFNITRIYLGADAVTGSHFLQEYIIFNSPFSDLKRQKITQNQAKRYNIVIG